MFDGKDFLTVARHLRDNGDALALPEAFYRSSVGRAYYACFHTYRAKYFPKAKWREVKRKKGKEHVQYVTHKQLRRKVRMEAGKTIGDILDSLAVLREHADYHSWTPSLGNVQLPPPSCHCLWNPDARQNSDYAIGLAETLLGGSTLTAPV